MLLLCFKTEIVIYFIQVNKIKVNRFINQARHPYISAIQNYNAIVKGGNFYENFS